jgi:hypothetical protein
MSTAPEQRLYYQTTSKSLEVVMDLLATMREDCEKWLPATCMN